MESSKVKHLIFDFFGTLVQYNHGYLSGEKYFNTHQFLLKNQFLIDYGKFEIAFPSIFNQLETQAKSTNREFSMQQVVEGFFLKVFSIVPDQEMLKQFIEIYHSEWNRQISYYPKLKPFLKNLKEKYTLSIITNTHYKPLIQAHLNKMEVADYFQLVLTSVECGIRKPNPKIFRKALEQLQAKPEAATFVGDSYSADYQGSLSVGMRPILIDPDGKYKRIVKDRVDSLFDILLLASI